MEQKPKVNFREHFSGRLGAGVPSVESKLFQFSVVPPEVKKPCSALRASHAVAATSPHHSLDGKLRTGKDYTFIH